MCISLLLGSIFTIIWSYRPFHKNLPLSASYRHRGKKRGSVLGGGLVATSLKPPMNFDREVPSNDTSHGTFVWKPSFEGKED